MSRSTAIYTGAIASGATKTVATGRSLLNSLQIVTDGVNAGTLTVYDNTTNSGTVIAVLTCLGTALSASFTPTFGIRTDIGLTFAVTGTGAVGYGSFGAA